MLPQLERILSREYHAGLFDCHVHGKVENEYYIQDGETFWNECPLCAKEAEEKKDRQRQEETWQKKRVKVKFFDVSWDNYVVSNDSQRQALEKVRAIGEGKSKRSILLLGNNGVGKTMLSSIALKEFRGSGAIYKMYEIAMKIKASYKANSTDTEENILNGLSSLGLLVIDEVGRQFGSDTEKNWLSYVIDERYEDSRPTILISNLKLMRDCSEEEKQQGLYIERYLGRDSVSRLVECADIVTIIADDYRRQCKA